MLRSVLLLSTARGATLDLGLRAGQATLGVVQDSIDVASESVTEATALTQEVTSHLTRYTAELFAPDAEASKVCPSVDSRGYGGKQG